MTQKELRISALKMVSGIEDRLLEAVKAFPPNWSEDHVWVAFKKISFEDNLSTDQVIEAVKRSYACFNEDHRVDGKEKTNGQ